MLIPNLSTVSLFAAGALMFLILGLIRRRRFRYVPVPLMTGNEREFFGRLRHALPDLLVFPQVSMAAIIAPAARGGRRRTAAFRRIAQKRVDYAVYTQNLTIVCVVELDDRMHNLGADARRDAYLRSAGIPTVRWHSRNKPDQAEIRQMIYLIRNSK